MSATKTVVPNFISNLNQLDSANSNYPNKKAPTLWVEALLSRCSFEMFIADSIKNGGGGENCTRVQNHREISIYKLSLQFPQIPLSFRLTAR